MKLKLTLSTEQKALLKSQGLSVNSVEDKVSCCVNSSLLSKYSSLLSQLPNYAFICRR